MLSATTLEFIGKASSTTAISNEGGEVVVAVELGIGKQKMQGLVMAPSADQSNLVVASVTPESKVAAV